MSKERIKLWQDIESSQIQLKSSTIAVYERYLKNYIEPNLGEIKLVKLEQANIQAFANKLLQNGLSARTVSAVISFMRAGLCEKSKIFAIKLPKHIQRELQPLSSDEQKRLETALLESDSINNVGIILCLYTGIRIGELCGLMWNDVDFAEGILYIRRTMERIKSNISESKTTLVTLLPKSENSTRSIPLPQFLIDMLHNHKRIFGGEYVISLKNKSIEPRMIQKRLKKLLKEAGIEYRNFHTVTRHTFATRALENGMDVKTLSEILGHANATFTLNRYAHSIDKHKRDCMEAVATARL